jgi:hypothetical protein
MIDFAKPRNQSVLCAKINFENDDENKIPSLNNMILSLKEIYDANIEEEFDNGTWGLLDLEVDEYASFAVGRLFRYKSQDIPKKSEEKSLYAETISDRVFYCNFLFDRDSQIIIFERTTNISENQFLSKIQSLINSRGKQINAYNLAIYSNMESFRTRVTKLDKLINIEFNLNSPNNPPNFITDLDSALANATTQTNAKTVKTEIQAKDGETLKFSGDLIEMAVQMVERTYGIAKVKGLDSQDIYHEIYSNEKHFERTFKCNDLMNNVKERYYKVRDDLRIVLMAGKQHE